MVHYTICAYGFAHYLSLNIFVDHSPKDEDSQSALPEKVCLLVGQELRNGNQWRVHRDWGSTGLLRGRFGVGLELWDALKVARRGLHVSDHFCFNSRTSPEIIPSNKQGNALSIFRLTSPRCGMFGRDTSGQYPSSVCLDHFNGSLVGLTGKTQRPPEKSGAQEDQYRRKPSGVVHRFCSARHAFLGDKVPLLLVPGLCFAALAGYDSFLRFDNHHGKRHRKLFGRGLLLLSGFLSLLCWFLAMSITGY